MTMYRNIMKYLKGSTQRQRQKENIDEYLKNPSSKDPPHILLQCVFSRSVQLSDQKDWVTNEISDHRPVC